MESVELKNKRLLKTFKETSQEVREMTYRLTGYRLDITSTDVYKLTNIYAASTDDYLIFKVSNITNNWVEYKFTTADDIL